ncbi:hypothetical protein [Microbacterium candidum]|uniref:Probable cytosol aminopeptidase n=1 Tax=Microbacterium candidum TaxID=3041922 RepID=A0ABT7N101_9MICO|nr:hypothetical protein [Microbacterium sp. ASV49]MDL9980388.1 hypothetical protein [Microbacterium sp. ASV49]
MATTIDSAPDLAAARAATTDATVVRPDPSHPSGTFAAALAAAGSCGGDVIVELDPAADTELIATGLAAGVWRYARPGVPELSRSLVLVGAAEAPLARARVIARAEAWVRQLVETPANLLGPRAFADEVRRFASEHSPAVVVAVWDAEDLAAQGFGGTLGVGGGSAQPPLVIELRTPGDGPVTALAGKGITFDSGGIDLKRDQGELAWMKTDMAAAASVAAAVIAIATLRPGLPLHAILPVAENMPGPAALRPGDVVAHPAGRTTEVVDTDCEGRLVLADALAWLAATGPARLVDVGTLTDSGGVGTAYWGCWGTSPALAAEVTAAGGAAGDPGWALPLHPSYDALLSSRVADSANAPTDAPDTGQVAATYLRPFAGDVPWLHIDNGSGAWLERDAGGWPAGPTGTPLRALIRWLSIVDS